MDRYFDRANYDTINHILSLTDWATILKPELSLNGQWSNFKSVIHSVIETHVPKTKVTLTKLKIVGTH